MSYLSEFDKAPEGEKFHLLRRWMSEDPVGVFAAFREGRPIASTPVATLVFRYRDVVEVLSVPTILTVKLYEPKMGNFMLCRDETIVNTRDKGIMQAMLSRDDLPRVRALVGSLADAALDGAGGEIEVVHRLGRKVPVQLVEQYFGLEGPDHETMMRWSYDNQLDAFNNHPFNFQPNAEEIHAKAQRSLEDMKNHLARFLPAKAQSLQENPAQDDVVARLLKTRFPAELGFDAERLVTSIGGLLIGAVETTQQAVAQIIDVLLKRPVQFAEARAAALADDDDLFDRYAWEALRFDPIVKFMFRYAAEDYTIAKGTERAHTVQAGGIVLPVTMSALFDPDEVPLPTEFNIHRKPAIDFHFGHGHHACLGRYVGGVMIPEIVKRVVRRDNLRALGPIDFKNTPFPEDYRLAYGAGCSG